MMRTILLVVFFTGIAQAKNNISIELGCFELEVDFKNGKKMVDYLHLHGIEEAYMDGFFEGRVKSTYWVPGQFMATRSGQYRHLFYSNQVGFNIEYEAQEGGRPLYFRVYGFQDLSGVGVRDDFMTGHLTIEGDKNLYSFTSRRLHTSPLYCGPLSKPVPGQ
ncbi:MAG: hypothetical protein AAF203_08410 [Pseudomonadota bacterium]